MSEFHDFLSFEEAAQHVNDNISLFWIVSCPLPLHVECFMPALVGVEDNQTMTGAELVFLFHLMLLSVHMCLVATVPV